MSEKCGTCGKEIRIGDWPFCPHEPAHEYHPFVPWMDYHIQESGQPVLVESLAQWNRLMRENNCEVRDKMSNGQFSAYRDRAMANKKEGQEIRAQRRVG